MSTGITLLGPVAFDGTTIRVGDVKLDIAHCAFKEVDFSFSPQYGLLLLNEATRVKAQRLLCELAELPLVDDAKKHLIRQAYEKGFEMAQFELEQYRQFVPIEEPKFYAERGYGKELDMRVVSLVSNKKALRFYSSSDMRAIVPHLPLNVYHFGTTYAGFGLTVERYRWLLGREKDFFVFVEELCRYLGYVRGDACSVCFNKYFEDPKQAYELLVAIRCRVSGRECRDKLFATLEQKSFLEFSLGLFVLVGWSVFFVSNNGEVQRLCYSKRVEMREAILKAYDKGKLPTKIEEVKDCDTLRRVAEVVGKLRPELTLLILP